MMDQGPIVFTERTNEELKIYRVELLARELYINAIPKMERSAGDAPLLIASKCFLQATIFESVAEKQRKTPERLPDPTFPAHWEHKLSNGNSVRLNAGDWASAAFESHLIEKHKVTNQHEYDTLPVPDTEYRMNWLLNYNKVSRGALP